MRFFPFWLLGFGLLHGQEEPQPAPAVEEVVVVTVEQLDEAKAQIALLEAELVVAKEAAAKKPDQAARNRVRELRRELRAVRTKFTRKLAEERAQFAKEEKELEKRISDLESKQKALNEDFDKALAEVRAEQGREAGNFEKRVMVAEGELENALMQLRKAEEIQKQNNEIWTEAVEDYRKKVEVAVRSAQVKGLQDSVSTTAKLAEDWQEERAELEAKVDEMRTKLDRVQGKLVEEKQDEGLESQLAAKSAALSALSTQAQELAVSWRSEREEAAAELANLQNQLKTAKTDTVEEEERARVLEQSLQRRNEALQELTTEAERLAGTWKEQRGGLQEEIAALELELEKTQSDLKLALAQSAKVENLREDKQELAAETAVLEEKLEVTDELSADLLAARTSENKLKNSLVLLRDSQGELESELEEFRKEKEADQQLITELRNEIKQLKSVHSAAEKDVNRYRAELGEALAKVGELEEAARIREQELTDAKEELAKLGEAAAENKTLKSSLEEKGKEVTELETELARLKATQQGLEKAMTATLEDFEKLQKNYASMQNENAAGGTAMEAALEQQAKAQMQLNSVQKSLQERDERLSAAQKRLQEIEQELRAAAEKAAAAEEAKEKAQEAEKEAREREQEEAAAGKAALGKREAELQLVRQTLNEERLGKAKLTEEAQKLREQVTTIAPVRYRLASADVASQQERVLAEVREVLAVYPEADLKIKGHTCDLGSLEANLRLSQERAEGLRDFLVQNEVAPERIVSAEGLADTEPEAENTSDENREQNRRVEIAVEL